MEIRNHFRIAKNIVSLFYTQFSATGFRFGFYSFFALIPGLGDMISVGLSLYILWIAIQFKVPIHKLFVMIFNIVFDLTVGSLPVAGDIVDTLYKSHVKNIKILEEYAGSPVIEGSFHE